MVQIRVSPEYFFFKLLFLFEMNNLSSINLLIKVFSTIENPWSLEKQPSIGHSFCHLLYRFNISLILSNSKKISGSGGIRTHASEETGALNQRLRPLGHATLTVCQGTFWQTYLRESNCRVDILFMWWWIFTMCHCLRPYHVESTSSRPITEVKQHWVALVLGWVTAWEYAML